MRLFGYTIVMVIVWLSAVDSFAADYVVHQADETKAIQMVLDHPYHTQILSTYTLDQVTFIDDCAVDGIMHGVTVNEIIEPAETVRAVIVVCERHLISIEIIPIVNEIIDVVVESLQSGTI